MYFIRKLFSSVIEASSFCLFLSPFQALMSLVLHFLIFPNRAWRERATISKRKSFIKCFIVCKRWEQCRWHTWSGKEGKKDNKSVAINLWIDINESNVFSLLFILLFRWQRRICLELSLKSIRLCVTWQRLIPFKRWLFSFNYYVYCYDKMQTNVESTFYLVQSLGTKSSVIEFNDALGSTSWRRFI